MHTGAEAADPCVHDQNSPYTYIHTFMHTHSECSETLKPKIDRLPKWYG